MLQYLLTGLAGVALGIVAMRVWQARDASPAGDGGNPADPPVAAPVAEGASSSRKLLIGAGVLALAAVGIMVLRGEDASAPGGAAMPGAAPAQILADVDTMIAGLAKRLEKDTDDGEGFRMLGWSYVMTGKPAEAIAPYKRALQLLPNSALVHSGYGEALTGVAGGKVTDEAKAEFDKALKIDPSEPRARYFDALWMAQHGQEKQALDKWIVLANSGPAEAPWQADVRRQIDATSKKLGIDVSGRIKTVAAPVAPGKLPAPDPAAVQAANSMSEGDRQAMVDRMVEGLADKLKANPDNPEGWAKLLRSRMVLGQKDQAAKDLIIARKALAGNAAGLALVNAQAKEVGVPGT